ncbi:GntR family transcriptional regulator [Arthrobacter sp. ISL-72]|uniref:GntR family transcriptional regulator n=1 Tax=Arthrobacter sp. ISL-72 TaxID=2819114 RepID=UPI001BEB50B9|nr:GntR family transcriptional regulator [Arthrobacter sp. ISL-72]MBT2595936.1 GntR family transcriptional regulator [Arthrobacter sp. ISL-72]
MSLQMTGPVTPTLVADQVYEVLEKAVLTGTLESGSPLRVRDLAAMVGTSVMPVREAIRRLEEAGLATRIPHKGAVVRTFTATELIHIYDVRTILEVQAATQGAPHVSRSGLREMEASCGRMRKAVAEGRIIDALDLDEDVLRTLYRASGNPVLVSTIEQLWLQCRPYKVIGATEALAKNDNTLWTPQPALVQALLDGDTAAATTITADSLASALRRLELRLETQ